VKGETDCTHLAIGCCLLTETDVDLYRLTIHELRDRIRAGQLSPVEVVQSFLTRIEQVEGRVQAFNTLTAASALDQAQRIARLQADRRPLPPLCGIPLGIKDVICTQGVRTTCSSRILERFVPPYNATVMDRLAAAGATMLGKLNMDEFAMGSSTENSAFRPTHNPWNLDCVPGGSSGGSAAAVAADMCAGALGTDTGGSIRQPGGFCGVAALKPTYGRVSRYGLIAYASSLDQIGPLAKDVRDAAILLGAIAGHDPKDSTSADLPVPDYEAALTGDIRGLRVGIPAEYFIPGTDPEVEAAVRAAIALLERLGAVRVPVTLPHTPYAIATYYLVATAEASSNLGRYDGVKYGHRTAAPEHLIDMYMKTRREGFGSEVKRRIMLGTYALSAGYYDAYYLKALKVRTLIRRDFTRAFECCDAILTPTSPTAAFRIGEKTDDPLQMYLADVFTVSVNLAGVPGMSVNCGFTESGLPIGLQLIGRPFDEATILRVAHAYEQAAPWRARRPGL
jgi:aspartyl-tRNA(Asn)/glutamyl-tRNA(Gln) amidotransferase subunit A